MLQNRMKLDLLKPSSSQRVVRHNSIMLLGKLLEMQTTGFHFRDTELEIVSRNVYLKPSRAFSFSLKFENHSLML